MYSGPPPCFRGKLSPTTRVEEIDPSRAGRYVDVGYFLLPDSQLDAHARFAEAARAAGCEAIVVEQHVEDWGDRSGEFGVRRFPELLAKCLVRAASCE